MIYYVLQKALIHLVVSPFPLSISFCQAGDVFRSLSGHLFQIIPTDYLHHTVPKHHNDIQCSKVNPSKVGNSHQRGGNDNYHPHGSVITEQQQTL